MSLVVTGVATVSRANLYAEGGATLSLPGLTSYTEPNVLTSSTLEATGPVSLLSLPALTSIAETGGYSTIYVEALSGGDLEMPLATQVNGPVQLMCIGGILDIGGSVVNMPIAGTGTTINVPELPLGISIDLGTSETLTAATFNIAQGDRVDLTSGTYMGATFNVAEGAVST